MKSVSDLTLEEVEDEINVLELKGYLYLQDHQGQPYIPDRVKLPNGKIYDEHELGAQLELTSQDAILLNAKRILDLHFVEGNEDARFASYNFLNDKDKKQATEKYSKSPIP